MLAYEAWHSQTCLSWSIARSWLPTVMDKQGSSLSRYTNVTSHSLNWTIEHFSIVLRFCHGLLNIMMIDNRSVFCTIPSIQLSSSAKPLAVDLYLVPCDWLHQFLTWYAYNAGLASLLLHVSKTRRCRYILWPNYMARQPRGTTKEMQVSCSHQNVRIADCL